MLFLHFASWNERVSHVQIECAFYFHLSHGLKSNVRHKRPDLTSTQEREPRTGYRESLTLTRNGSQYTIKQHNNLLAKRNLVGQRSTSVIEKEVNSIVSGPCYGKPFLFVCWRQIHSVVSYVGFKWFSDKIIFNESVALTGKWSFSIEHVTVLWSYSRPCIRLLIPIKKKEKIQTVIFKFEFSCMLLAWNVYTSTYSSFSCKMDYFSTQSRWLCLTTK